MIPIELGLQVAMELAQVANQWMAKSKTANDIVQIAQAEGRTTLTSAEYEKLTAVDDIERGSLDKAIEQAKKEGR